MPQSIRRARRRPPGSGPFPSRRDDVPTWLEQHYQVAAAANPCAAGELQPDPELPGLPEARAAAIAYLVHRSGPELRANAAAARLPDVAIVRYRRALSAELAATRAPTPAERKELLVRFVQTLQTENRRQAAPGTALPLRAVIAIAWWEGYRRTAPTRHSVRDVERLLQRRS